MRGVHVGKHEHYGSEVERKILGLAGWPAKGNHRVVDEIT